MAPTEYVCETITPMQACEIDVTYAVLMQCYRYLWLVAMRILPVMNACSHWNMGSEYSVEIESPIHL